MKPDFIRVEADELTYNLHIMIRFELERAMLRGDLSPADLPGAWNEKYESYLNITPSNDSKGCLQDIHWSMGAMGYFPTYTLGNLYAAQFFDAASEALPDLEASFARGEFSPLLQWLRKEIHSQGQRYRPEALCETVTGKPLSADALVNYLSTKFRAVYGLIG